MCLIKFTSGNECYQIDRSIINNFPTSLLAKSAESNYEIILIDRSPKYFKYIYNYLKKLSIPKSSWLRSKLKEEAKFYKLDDMFQKLKMCDDHIKYPIYNNNTYIVANQKIVQCNGSTP